MVWLKGKGVGKKNNFREGGVEGRREDKKKKAEKRLKFPTVLIKILLHAFLPRVPPDCPWSFLLIHKISPQWLRLMISGADKHKSWWNIAAAPIGSLQVKTQTSHENSSSSSALGGWGGRDRRRDWCVCSPHPPAGPPPPQLSPLLRHPEAPAADISQPHLLVDGNACWRRNVP